MMERLPLSIKVDNESSLYTDLIQPKRDSRELTTFIVQLLELYHEKEEVKELLMQHISENNPYTEMQERLKELNIKHERNVTNRTFIGQYTEIEQEKAEEEYARKSGKVEEEPVDTSDKSIDAFIAKILPRLQEAMEPKQAPRVEQPTEDNEKQALRDEIMRLRGELSKKPEVTEPVPEEVTKKVTEPKPKQAPEMRVGEETIEPKLQQEVKKGKPPILLVGGEEPVVEVEKSEKAEEAEKTESKPRVSSAFSKLSKSL